MVLISSKQSRTQRPIRSLVLCFAVVTFFVTGAYGTRMVRLCIASVDPMKLSSQCVMCNRREFPLTTFDCTGITKINELISNPLSVQEATCLIYNCRRQVPDIKPEPYHGSVSHAMRANYPTTPETRTAYGIIPPPGIYGGYPTPVPAAVASPMARYPIGYSGSMRNEAAISTPPPLGAVITQMLTSRQQALPYGLIPPHYTFPFG